MHERFCTRWQDGKGDEKHIVFESSALQHIRDEYPALFPGHHTMQSFINQADQRSIFHFISECLDCSNHMVGSGPLVGQRYWVVLVYDLTLSRWCMHRTWRFRRSTAAFWFC